MHLTSQLKGRYVLRFNLSKSVFSTVYYWDEEYGSFCREIFYMKVTFIYKQHFKINTYGWWLLPQSAEQNKNNSPSKGMKEIAMIGINQGISVCEL